MALMASSSNLTTATPLLLGPAPLQQCELQPYVLPGEKADGDAAAAACVELVAGGGWGSKRKEENGRLELVGFCEGARERWILRW